MPDFPELLVLRHGETEWNREGRMQGVLDSPLTGRGRDQAAQQGRILSAIDLGGFDCLVSPQGRARATADIALNGLGIIARPEPDLAEIAVGDWSGRLREELIMELPAGAQVEETPDGALGLYEYAPGGEGFAALETRCEALLSRLQRPTLLITHGITSRMLRAVWLGLGRAALGEMPGGQGVVFHLRDGLQQKLQ